MATLKYREFTDTEFEIVGRNEEVLATVERGEDGLWRILLKPVWVQQFGDLNFGPFSTSDEAFEELGADTADQS